MALSTLAVLLVSSTMSRADLLSWGWRLPFVASGVGRARVVDAAEGPRDAGVPPFAVAGTVVRRPIAELLRRQPKVLLACVS